MLAHSRNPKQILLLLLGNRNMPPQLFHKAENMRQFWTTKRFFARIADVTESGSTAGNARHGSSNPFQSREEIMKSLLPIAAAAVAALLGTTGIAKADDVLTTLGAMHVSGWQGDCL